MGIYQDGLNERSTMTDMRSPLTTRASAGSVPKAYYSPPWADMSIIGVAGSSGSGKTSLAIEIIKSLNLPWVILLSIVWNLFLYRDAWAYLHKDSFYKSLTPEQNKLAHANEYDLDSPTSIDFDLLYEKLKELKQG
jgi:uridine kinase